MSVWRLSHRFDPAAVAIADRHYSRQTPGSSQFVPPGRCLVLLAATPAVWATSWPMFAQHEWAGAWVCSMFRKEGPGLASTMIRAAVAHTRWRWPTVPDLGMVTFVNAATVRHKRDPGRCFLRAGFHHAGRTAGGLVVLQLDPADMPDPEAPLHAQGTFLFETAL